MRKIVDVVCVIGFLLLNVSLFAQKINPSLLNSKWSALWIAVPEESAKDYGVYFFRKQLSLDTKPSSFVIHVSADNRYKLYVNNTLVSLGPARGDYYYWNYETVDIAQYLKSGNNVIGAIVWNTGDFKPEYQISLRTGFILQGDSQNEEIINTNKSWKCIRNKSYQPLTGIGYSTYYVAGPGEVCNMNEYPANWLTDSFDDHLWHNASPISYSANGTPKGLIFGTEWMLVPSTLPQMELSVQRFSALRKSTGVKIPTSFPAAKSDIIVPANSNITLLLDQSHLTNAFFSLNFSNGKNAGIRIRYAETLYKKLIPGTYDGVLKGNRNEVEGFFFAGRKDSIISSGNTKQNFTTLDWRTYRYVEISITTQTDPLTIDDVYGTFTGYPFIRNAKFNSGVEDLNNILDIGWRTARLCAMETYMDCPYYEQLQYIGDTRIQGLVSFYNSGDDRLVRNALNQMDHSRIAEGITLSRHPSYTPQQIPTFSLWYIGMLHDYWMYKPDSLFVKEKLIGMRGVLDFFAKFQSVDGSLKNVPYWLFTDWVDDEHWKNGVGPIDSNGNSSILDLQLLWAYLQAAELEKELGIEFYAQDYLRKAEQLKNTIRVKYWDQSKGLFADTPEKKTFSQHANTLAILTDVVNNSDAVKVADIMLTDKTLAPASIYFKFYLHLALVRVGKGDDYIKWLDKWRENISMGLTTWAEDSELSTTRSDCHAWGASPNIELFRTILGIDSDAPGFKVIKVEPHLGTLTNVNGEIPHPNGKVSASYQFSKKIWTIEISLPENTKGYFIWKGERFDLRPGMNRFVKS
jgi:alpha-L-rhamnosidase